MNQVMKIKRKIERKNFSLDKILHIKQVKKMVFLNKRLDKMKKE